MATRFLELHRNLKPTGTPLLLVRSGIRIFAHQDEAGQAAADRWTQQLKDTGRVDRFSFQDLSRSDGEPVKDLNDLLKISTDSYRRNAKGINNVMRF